MRRLLTQETDARSRIRIDGLTSRAGYLIRQRLEQYSRETQPLMAYFRESGVPCFEVDGSEGTPQGIANRICGLIARS